MRAGGAMPAKRSIQTQTIESIEVEVDELVTALDKARKAETALKLARRATAKLVTNAGWGARQRATATYRTAGESLRESERQARKAVGALERKLEARKGILAGTRARYGHGR